MAGMNRRESMRNTKHTKNDPQKKYRLGTVSKNILLEGLNRFHGINPTLSSDVDRDTLSLQCYSILSDILVKKELCIPQMFYLLVKVSFTYLLPVSLKSLCISVLSTKRQFRSVL